MKYIKKITFFRACLSAWLKDVSLFETFIKYNVKLPSIDNGGSRKIAVIVHPWGFTAVPFFSFATAIFLKKRGNEVELLVDDIPFGKRKLFYRIQIWKIKYLSNLLSRFIGITYLSNLEPLEDSSILTDECLKNLCKQNGVHHFKGELDQNGRNQYEGALLNQLRRARPHINRFFSNAKYDSIHLAGGIYGDTGLYVLLAEKLKIRANTFDSGFGVLVSSTNGVAAQLKDIPYAVQLLKSEINENDFNYIRAFSIEQIEHRKAGTDTFGFLDTGIDLTFENQNTGVLILLNSVWDSAALGIHSIYGGYNEWLISTVSFILKETNENITIRQHPGEKLDYQMPNDDLEAYINEKFNHSSRINFVNCNAKINTYQLIDSANLVICFSSTTGIESSILGKIVIVASHCYYSNEEFVFKPTSEENYYANIQKGLERILIVPPSGIYDAILFYYLGQCCNWVFTDFTPMPEDFRKWVEKFATLKESKEVEMYLTSIEENLPISLLVARNKIKLHGIK